MECEDSVSVIGIIVQELIFKHYSCMGCMLMTPQSVWLYRKGVRLWSESVYLESWGTECNNQTPRLFGFWWMVVSGGMMWKHGCLAFCLGAWSRHCHKHSGEAAGQVEMWGDRWLEIERDIAVLSIFELNGLSFRLNPSLDSIVSLRSLRTSNP
jgi:hypothetical protein